MFVSLEDEPRETAGHHRDRRTAECSCDLSATASFQLSNEPTIMVWCLVLAVVQILMPSILCTQETGPDYNASPRDNPSPVPESTVTGCLRRAQANLFEPLPLFAAAILIAHKGGKEGALTFTAR